MFAMHAPEMRAALQLVLDALPDQVALLDARGGIVVVNREWLRFARENGGDPRAVGPDVNYLDVWRSAGANDTAEDDARQQLAAVLGGQRERMELEYPCNSPLSQRWFLMRATHLPGGGALVVHTDITRRKAAELELADQARRDSLTGLLNRRGLMTRWPRFERDDVPVWGLLIDCDDFKRINEVHGHAGGDLVLREIARRFLSCSRPTDTISRIGGDEFLWLLDARSATDAHACAERVRAAIGGTPFDIFGESVSVTSSAAIVRITPRIRTLEQLLLAAQSGLRESKTKGKNRVSGLLPAVKPRSAEAGDNERAR